VSLLVEAAGQVTALDGDDQAAAGPVGGLGRLAHLAGPASEQQVTVEFPDPPCAVGRLSVPTLRHAPHPADQS